MNACQKSLQTHIFVSKVLKNHKKPNFKKKETTKFQKTLDKIQQK